MSEQRNDLYDSRQRGSRFNRGNVGIIIFIALIIFLLVRSGFYCRILDFGRREVFVNFVKDRHYMMIVKGLWATLKMTIIASLLCGHRFSIEFDPCGLPWSKIGILNFGKSLHYSNPWHAGYGTDTYLVLYHLRKCAQCR